MNYFLRALLIIVFVSAISNGCKSDEESLPAPTSEGLNTFGCKIDGKVWIANGLSNESGPSAKAIDAELRIIDSKTFYLMIHTSSDSGERVQLTLPKGNTGSNGLGNLYDKSFGIYYDNQFRIFHSMETNPGKVVITRLDTINQIVSGTFEFDAEYVIDKKVVKVTEGRFDIDLKTL
ncbi:DUF6252 family protein [Dyadobacter sp. CY345]|uniref:DUF6252 family protein n=1 Tax=Dyadobacter sp. CY345 TaxID=2909335 RepID=UPI001F270385|nr:DUF6252 family protein [Dyadobacter sp. CY345]MCF2447087.1 DUF6252 family protein [Dyadobacter sp. CY345]